MKIATDILERTLDRIINSEEIEQETRMYLYQQMNELIHKITFKSKTMKQITFEQWQKGRKNVNLEAMDEYCGLSEYTEQDFLNLVESFLLYDDGGYIFIMKDEAINEDNAYHNKKYFVSYDRTDFQSDNLVDVELHFWNNFLKYELNNPSYS